MQDIGAPSVSLQLCITSLNKLPLFVWFLKQHNSEFGVSDMAEKESIHSFGDWRRIPICTFFKDARYDMHISCYSLSVGHIFLKNASSNLKG